jgi:hypothetical protein
MYWSSAAPFDAAAVHDARRDLETLAAELRSRDTVSARGVALAELLLIDYDSPLYGGAKADGLPEAARRAAEALRLATKEFASSWRDERGKSRGLGAA